MKYVLLIYESPARASFSSATRARSRWPVSPRCIIGGYPLVDCELDRQYRHPAHDPQVVLADLGGRVVCTGNPAHGG